MDLEDESDDEILPNTPQNKKLLIARAKAKAEKEKVRANCAF